VVVQKAERQQKGGEGVSMEKSRPKSRLPTHEQFFAHVQRRSILELSLWGWSRE
jgi:hypothetical protein